MVVLATGCIPLTCVGGASERKAGTRHDGSMACIPLVACAGGQRVADDSRNIRRAHEPPGPGGALRRRDAEALVGEQHDAHLRGLLPGAGRVGAVGLQDGLRHAGRREGQYGLLQHDARRSGERPRARRRGGTGRNPVDNDWAAVPLPAGVTGLLPVRLRGDHADPDARVGTRADQLQGVDPLRAPLDHLRVHGQRLPALGRWLLRGPRRLGLLGRLRDPPDGRHLGLRGRVGDRSASCSETGRSTRQTTS